jgi:hypothetical protein
VQQPIQTHSKDDFIDVEISDGHINRKIKTKVVGFIFGKKKAITHYRLIDRNGNEYIKSY